VPCVVPVLNKICADVTCSMIYLLLIIVAQTRFFNERRCARGNNKNATRESGAVCRRNTGGEKFENDCESSSVLVGPGIICVFETEAARTRAKITFRNLTLLFLRDAAHCSLQEAQ
jgi:hypothetical protein